MCYNKQVRFFLLSLCTTTNTIFQVNNIARGTLQQSILSLCSSLLWRKRQTLLGRCQTERAQTDEWINYRLVIFRLSLWQQKGQGRQRSAITSTFANDGLELTRQKDQPFVRK
ncbi:hypothetical protein NPIL_374631 [Nephila pilipes]|uniref:Uncharacterized protein n=1 Tax=Nephila pilipes TaxID=299642 RepID=A0A8X6N3M2_NEPPI|nr:hypothetical protein NPIL_374631 [Nephila pilipes]